MIRALEEQQVQLNLAKKFWMKFEGNSICECHAAETKSLPVIPRNDTRSPPPFPNISQGPSTTSSDLSHPGKCPPFNASQLDNRAQSSPPSLWRLVDLDGEVHNAKWHIDVGLDDWNIDHRSMECFEVVI